MYYLLSYELMFSHSVYSVLLLCTLYYLRITVYVLFIVYVTLPPGIGPIAVGNKYILYIYINKVRSALPDSQPYKY
jgi:hypothetical protein